TLDDEYQVAVVRGIQRAAQSARVLLVAVAGGFLGSPDPHAKTRNFVYDLIGPDNIDALIVLAGPLANHLGQDAFSQWLARYDCLPIVSVGLDLEGYSSVFVDNASGVEALVTHLVEVHQHRRIAFLRGPAESAEANARYYAFRRAL